MINLKTLRFCVAKNLIKEKVLDVHEHQINHFERQKMINFRTFFISINFNRLYQISWSRESTDITFFILFLHLMFISIYSLSFYHWKASVVGEEIFWASKIFFFKFLRFFYYSLIPPFTGWIILFIAEIWPESGRTCHFEFV